MTHEEDISILGGMTKIPVQFIAQGYFPLRGGTIEPARTVIAEFAFDCYTPNRIFASEIFIQNYYEKP